MLNYIFSALFCLVSLTASAQTSPDVYLFEIKTTPTTLEILSGKNISQNPKYDNQPSFYDDHTVLYSHTRDSLTTISAYDIKLGKNRVFTNEPSNGFFSPQRLPESEAIVMVRQDSLGKQRMVIYDYNTAKFIKEVDSNQVGYFTFYNNDFFIASVLVPNQMDLYSGHISKQNSKMIMNNVGRSLQKVPKSKSLSYTVVNEDQNLDLYVLDLSGDEPTSYFVCELPIGRQDYTWLDENRILVGSGDSLFVYDLFGEPAWQFLVSLNKYQLTNITRISISPDGKHLALAAEPVE